MEFEDLLLRPENTLSDINKHLGIELTNEDLGNVYHGQLYRKSNGLGKKLKATAIYLKNYNQRYR